MDLEVLAQIITGTATLIVAFVLMYQLRQQHKDTEIQISMMSETLNERIHNFGNYDKDYSEVIYKGLKIELEELYKIGDQEELIDPNKHIKLLLILYLSTKLRIIFTLTFKEKH